MAEKGDALCGYALSANFSMPIDHPLATLVAISLVKVGNGHITSRTYSLLCAATFKPRLRQAEIVGATCDILRYLLLLMKIESSLFSLARKVPDRTLGQRCTAVAVRPPCRVGSMEGFSSFSPDSTQGVERASSSGERRQFRGTPRRSKNLLKKITWVSNNRRRRETNTAQNWPTACRSTVSQHLSAKFEA